MALEARSVASIGEIAAGTVHGNVIGALQITRPQVASQPARAPLLPRAARAGSGMHDLFTPLSVGRFNRALQRRELEPVEAVPRQRQ